MQSQRACSRSYHDAPSKLGKKFPLSVSWSPSARQLISAMLALLASSVHGLAVLCTTRPALTVTQHHSTACTSGCVLHSLATSRSCGVHMMAAPDEDRRATEERKEALLGLGIMSGLFGGTFGFYYVLTSLGGVDEVLAGQLHAAEGSRRNQLPSAACWC